VLRLPAAVVTHMCGFMTNGSLTMMRSTCRGLRTTITQDGWLNERLRFSEGLRPLLAAIDRYLSAAH
jgi:hypothetical protein